MELPTLDHPGWGRLLAVVAHEQGPRPLRHGHEVVRTDDAAGPRDRGHAEPVVPAESDMYA